MRTFGLLAAVVVVLALASAVSARSAFQPFANPTLAAQRLTVAARAQGMHLFHRCAVVNPYLIRCGGYFSGLKPLSTSGKLRARMDWRKVNPYMLYRTTYLLGGVFERKFIDTRVAY